MTTDLRMTMLEIKMDLIHICHMSTPGRSNRTNDGDDVDGNSHCVFVFRF